MAITAKSSNRELFALLRSAPDDTYYQVYDFLQRQICDPLNVKLQDMGDKTLVRHLKALMHGDVAIRCGRSAQQRKRSNNSPIKAKLLPFGIGDASRQGEWRDAINALERLVNEKKLPDGRRMRVGEALYWLHQRAFGYNDNRFIVAVVPWLLGEEPSDEMVSMFRSSMAHHLSDRLTDPDWEARSRVLLQTWFSTDRSMNFQLIQQGNKLPQHEDVYLEVLECAEYLAGGNRERAEALAALFFPDLLCAR